MWEARCLSSGWLSLYRVVADFSGFLCSIESWTARHTVAGLAGWLADNMDSDPGQLALFLSFS